MSMRLEEWVAAGLGCAAVVCDLRWRVIPNWLAVLGLAAGLILNACSSGWHGATAALSGTAAGLAVFLVFHFVGGMGGGDVKLMAAFGAVLGPAGILTAAVLAAIAGALMSAVALLLNRRTAAIPYAPAIVAGVWLALLARR